MSPVAIVRRAASAAESSSSAGGRWNCELADALDERAREERPVADQPELAEEVLAGGLRLERRQAPRLPASAPRTASARAAGGAVRAREPSTPPKTRADSSSNTTTACGETVDVEALGELRDPGELVGDGRDHGAAQPLQPALEVQQGAVALERARRGQHEVGPADGEAVEHRDRDHVLGALGERADGRVGRGLVAGDDQQPDRLRVRLVLVGGRRPGGGDAAAVRRCGQVERAAAGLALEAECVRGLGEPGAAAAAAAATRRGSPARRRGAAAPSSLPALASARAARPRLRRARSARFPSGRSARSRRRCGAAALSQRSTTGARSATSSSPTRTTISAVGERRERQPERVERVGGRLGQHGGVGAEPAAQEPGERVGLLERLGAGERGDDAACRRREAAPRRGRARHPS